MCKLVIWNNNLKKHLVKKLLKEYFLLLVVGWSLIVDLRPDMLGTLYVFTTKTVFIYSSFRTHFSWNESKNNEILDYSKKGLDNVLCISFSLSEYRKGSWEERKTEIDSELKQERSPLQQLWVNLLCRYTLYGWEELCV